MCLIWSSYKYVYGIMRENIHHTVAVRTCWWNITINTQRNQSGKIKSNLNCNNNISINLTWSGIPFGINWLIALDKKKTWTFFFGRNRDVTMEVQATIWAVHLKSQAGNAFVFFYISLSKNVSQIFWIPIS